MRKYGMFALLALLACPGPTFGQARVPDSGMTAAGVDVGVLFPGDALEPGPIVNGFLEYYMTPRAGLRATVGWADLSFENREDEDSQRQFKLALDLLYAFSGKHLTWRGIRSELVYHAMSSDFPRVKTMATTSATARPRAVSHSEAASTTSSRARRP